MSGLKLFGLELDESGSNISQLDFLFADGTGEKFRTALGRAFFAAYQTNPKKDEWWDTAVQHQLKQQEQDLGLVKGCQLLLEKTTDTANDVWQYGYHVFQDTPSTKRPWCLPDGIIQLPNQPSVIALELDHGQSAGDWASKLLKAIRSTASAQIEGVLFCYSVESKHPLFKGRLFSPEFEEAMGSKADDKGCYLKKTIGILNIRREDLEQFNQPS